MFDNPKIIYSWKLEYASWQIVTMHMTVYLLFALQAGTYTLKIKFGEIK